MNFVHSNPLVCTSVGLTINKKLVAGYQIPSTSSSSSPSSWSWPSSPPPGVINCPLVGLCYTAVRGKGAFCNGKRLKTSGCKDISKVNLKIGRRSLTNNLKHFQNFPRSHPLHSGAVDHGTACGCEEGEEGGGAEQPLCDHGQVGSSQHHHYHHHKKYQFWYPPKCPKWVILAVFGHFGGTDQCIGSHRVFRPRELNKRLCGLILSKIQASYSLEFCRWICWKDFCLKVPR